MECLQNIAQNHTRKVLLLHVRKFNKHDYEIVWGNTQNYIIHTLNKTKVIAVEMYYCCKEGLTISGTILLLELVIWMVVKELLHFCMTGLNELIICVLQSLV